MKMTVLSLLLTMIVQPCFAGVYKWVDENGQVHYGERPPPAVPEAKQMTLDKAPAPDPHTQERQERLRNYLEASSEDREKRKEEEAEAKSRAKEQAAQAEARCKAARSHIHSLKNGGVLYRMDENGKRHYMSDTQRASELKQAQAAVNKWCK